MYECETWSLILREELRLKVFENRGLRRIFGHKKAAVTGEWRKVHNEELNDLHFRQIFFGLSNQEKIGRAGLEQV